MNGMRRVSFYIHKELLARIETYWHKKKLKNRTVTFRELLKRGLEKDTDKNTLED